jgi:hypothetical protein
MQKNLIVRRATHLAVMIVAVAMFSGCTMTGGGSGVQPVASEELAPVSTMVGSYGDIELPIDMKLVPTETMAMRTDSFQGGIHIYRGRVDINSLRDFIIASMRNYKWKLAGEASTKDVMLAFTKPNKTCMVVLANDSMGTLGKTQADFYITEDVAAGNRLNPFGEPVN